jgi:iron(III) transport system ATP-binding protein
MVEVRTDHISKTYGKKVALNDINITVKDGTLACFLGPSGSGKTTLLRIIAGLIEPTQGRVFFDNVDVTNLPAWRRNVGFVPQSITLFPHLTVYENIAFGLKAKKVPREEMDRRIKEMLKLIRLEGYENRKATELSGGEAQRVAIARALVINPSVLLFDEPLGQLDAKLRDELKFEIRRIQRETGTTGIYVTHDQAEAFAIADYIYVINKGKVEQEGTPYDLYENPVSPFIAEFIGSVNFLKGTIISVSKDTMNAKVKAKDLEIKVQVPESMEAGKEVLVGIRPENIKVMLHLPSEKEENTYVGTVNRKIFLGSSILLEIEAGNQILKSIIYGDEKYKFLDINPGTQVYITLRRAFVFTR